VFFRGVFFDGRFYPRHVFRNVFAQHLPQVFSCRELYYQRYYQRYYQLCHRVFSCLPGLSRASGRLPRTLYLSAAWAVFSSGFAE